MGCNTRKLLSLIDMVYAKTRCRINGFFMAISANLASDGGVLTITVQGRFDFNALHLFRGTYEKITPKPKKYIIDLRESDYLDSSALGMLLALRDFAGGNGADISLMNCNQDVKKILIITKLDELFKIP